MGCTGAPQATAPNGVAPRAGPARRGRLRLLAPYGAGLSRPGPTTRSSSRWRGGSLLWPRCQARCYNPRLQAPHAISRPRRRPPRAGPLLLRLRRLRLHPWPGLAPGPNGRPGPGGGWADARASARIHHHDARASDFKIRSDTPACWSNLNTKLNNPLDPPGRGSGRTRTVTGLRLGPGTLSRWRCGPAAAAGTPAPPRVASKI